MTAAELLTAIVHAVLISGVISSGLYLVVLAVWFATGQHLTDLERSARRHRRKWHGRGWRR